MKLVIFGLTISSSWGNGHATLLRGLFRALVNKGHEIVFFERDVPYYAAHRDLTQMSGVRLVLYEDWGATAELAEVELRTAEVGMVTSYCPDGIAASELVCGSNTQLKVFYDLDTPVTLEYLRAGQRVAYIGQRGLADFNLVLSYTGGAALIELQRVLGARFVVPLYGSVDPFVHRPVQPVDIFRYELSYLGTYADDRQRALETLFIEPARRAKNLRFLIGGSKYPETFPWTENIFFVQHIRPASHPAFYCSSRITLNITRRAMAQMGYCPSGRLFEAAACGVPILSDYWEGLDQFFTPGKEIFVGRDARDTLEALSLSDDELNRIGSMARERSLEEHTAERRAGELEAAFDAALDPQRIQVNGEMCASLARPTVEV
jgi:spore maturation protein CgeB